MIDYFVSFDLSLVHKLSGAYQKKPKCALVCHHFRIKEALIHMLIRR